MMQDSNSAILGGVMEGEVLAIEPYILTSDIFITYQIDKHNSKYKRCLTNDMDAYCMKNSFKMRDL